MKNIIVLLLLLNLGFASCEENQQDTSHLSLEYSISSATLIDSPDGEINISVTGGEKPYTYLWSTGSIEEDLHDVGVGQYSVTVTDANNQSISDEINFTMNNIIYLVPADETDGWPTSHVNDYTNKPDLIYKALESLQISNNEIHSILVAINGKLVVEDYYSGYDFFKVFHNFTRHTPHEIQSASKSYRSAMIGIAIDKGFILDENTLLIDLLPEYSHLLINGKEKITLKHVLTMSMGIDWDEDSDLKKMYNTIPNSRWNTFLLSKPLKYNPGTMFNYNTASSLMLTTILQESVSPNLESFVKTNYEAKIETNNTHGQPNMTPRDMLKLGQVFLNNGKWKETQIISPEWINKSFKEVFKIPSMHNSSSYGYSWWMKDIQTQNNNYTCYFASGNGGQYIMIIKELNCVVVFTGGNFNSVKMYKPLEMLGKFILPAIE